MQSRSIIVIGMHRSGTSAISGLLAELGVFMGSSLFAPQKGVNEKGFYENSLVVKINERLLDEKNWSWDHPLAYNLHAEDISSITKFVAPAVKALDADYGKNPLWGMKDPRTSLLIPFWKIIFKELNVKPTYLLMVRPPDEVYGSLKKRDHFSLEKSLMLWLNYTLSAYFSTKSEDLCILSYHDLLENPDLVAKKIASSIDLEINLDERPLNFVDRRLQNQKKVPLRDDVLSSLAIDLYTAMTSAKINHSHIIDISSRYMQYLDNLNPVLIEHLNNVKGNEVYYRHLFLDAYKSFWWKFSWPIKKIENFIRIKNRYW